MRITVILTLGFLAGCYNVHPQAYQDQDEIIIETVLPSQPGQPKQTVTKKTVKKKPCPPCPTCDKQEAK